MQEHKEREVKKSNEVDLVFLVDCTASMGPFISEAQRNISSIIEKIQATETRDVRFGLICYRDHKPQDKTFVTKTYDFTKSVTKARGYVNEMRAEGGGDIPEAVGAALQAALDLNYRKSAAKIVVIITDAPPHGLCKHQPDGFPKGDPTGDVMSAVWKMAEQGIIIYSIGCTIISRRPFAREWFQAISGITGGRYISLENSQILAEVIVGGAEEEIELEKLAKQVEEETKIVEKELKERGETMNEENICLNVTQRLQSRGVEVNTLMIDQTDADQVENREVITLLQVCKTMEQVRQTLNDRPFPIPYTRKEKEARYCNWCGPE
eukprot:TRINITY_DN2017_c0_g1_i1.p1 TRINITY_DN2017_c0_g1~~TRINITY_DN2017_c0_g1_i1.p1  ORF type:complete len:323 (-),score=58.33 TRINITY_DN2017_c0_g1_i1:194-1162(-)